MSPVITLTTDFGWEYAAAMKGVILSINPQATIVDISHSVAPQDILEGAFIFAAAYPYYPPGTIHIVVVDPGVGSERRAVGLRTGGQFFLAPDNGVLSYVIENALGPAPWEEGLGERVLGSALEAVVLTNPAYWRHPVSATFHGRDIFAPVAAHLSLGVPLEKFGEKIPSLYVFSLPRLRREGDGSVSGQVIHIDPFGNLITNIRAGDVPSRPVKVEIAGRVIQGISPYYAAGEELLATIGSSGYLEVAARGGSAAHALGVGIGEKVRVTPQ